jgi:hypothetical protein
MTVCDTPPIIAAAMAKRQAAGFHIRFFGERAEADGVVANAFAKDSEQLARWQSIAARKGYDWEIVR